MTLGHRLAIAERDRLRIENAALRRQVAELEDFIAAVSPDYPIDLTEPKATDTSER